MQINKRVIIILLKIINKFEKLDKKIKYIIILFIITTVMFFTTEVIKKNIDKNTKFKYTFSTIEEILDENKSISSRKTYFEIRNIINSYFSTKGYDEIGNKSNYEYSDYYSVLSNEYKKVISKKNYLKLSSEFIDRFIYKDPANEEISKIAPFDISKIYSFENNIYLCKLEVDFTRLDDYIIKQYVGDLSGDRFGYKMSKGYIGIKLYENHNKYEIVYME